MVTEYPVLHAEKTDVEGSHFIGGPLDGRLMMQLMRPECRPKVYRPLSGIPGFPVDPNMVYVATGERDGRGRTIYRHTPKP